METRRSVDEILNAIEQAGGEWVAEWPVTATRSADATLAIRGIQTPIWIRQEIQSGRKAEIIAHLLYRRIWKGRAVMAQIESANDGAQIPAMLDPSTPAGRQFLKWQCLVDQYERAYLAAETEEPMPVPAQQLDLLSGTDAYSARNLS